MAKVPNAVEILPKIWTSWVGRTNVTARRQTDGRQQIANVSKKFLVSGLGFNVTVLTHDPGDPSRFVDHDPLTYCQVLYSCTYIYRPTQADQWRCIGDRSPTAPLMWVYLSL